MLIKHWFAFYDTHLSATLSVIRVLHDLGEQLLSLFHLDTASLRDKLIYSKVTMGESTVCILQFGKNSLFFPKRRRKWSCEGLGLSFSIYLSYYSTSLGAEKIKGKSQRAEIRNNTVYRTFNHISLFSIIIAIYFKRKYVYLAYSSSCSKTWSQRWISFYEWPKTLSHGGYHDVRSV